MVTIGLGTGGIKANVTPMCGEQYANAEPTIKTLKSGEKVIVDPELTIQRLFMWCVQSLELYSALSIPAIELHILILLRFYWVVNIGALSPLITVTVEAHHSFWLAYLIPLM